MNNLNSSYILLPSQDTIVKWIKEGNVQNLKQLLESGFDFFEEDYHARISAQEGQVEIFSLILKHGYLISDANFSVCRDAIYCGQLNFLIFCLLHIEKTEKYSHKLNSLKREWMKLAIENNHIHIVEHFINHHMNIDNEFLELAMDVKSLPIFELLFIHRKSNIYSRFDLIKTMKSVEHLPYLEIILKYHTLDLNNFNPLVGNTHPTLINYIHSYQQSLESYHQLNQILPSQKNTSQPKI